MAKQPGNAVHTDHLAVAIAPDFKNKVVAFAKTRDVNLSVIVRWALTEYLAVHGDTADPEAEGTP